MTQSEKDLVCLQIQNIIDFDEALTTEKRHEMLFKLVSMIQASGKTRKKAVVTPETMEQGEGEAHA